MRYAVVAVVAVLFGAITVSSGLADQDTTTVEYKLAVVQTGAYVAPDDPLVLAYANVLDRVQPRCGEDRLQLGNIAAALAAKVDQESVFTATPLSLLQGLDNAATADVYGPDNPANCAQLLAVVAYLASEGD